MKVRINKFLAGAGVCARRKADDLVAAGRVSINGKVVTKLGTTIDEKADRVEVDGKKVGAPEKMIYVALNKPPGYVVTRRAFKSEKSVYDLLPENLRAAVWPVGRLDKDSEGLLFFTNDGDLTQRVSHPSFSHEKEYLVQTAHEISGATLERLRKGIDLEEGTTASARFERQGYKSYQVVLQEGKNRQIRRMMADVGAHVVTHKRVRVQNFKLGNLKPGTWQLVAREDIIGP